MAIPVQAIVSVTPNVIDAGGSGIDLVGLVLTNNAQVPIGSVASLATAADVAAYFGPSSAEASFANTYFYGYDGSPIKPAALLFAQYPTAAVRPYLRGARLNLTLAQLQALTGTFTISADGRTKTSAAVNLSGVASFSQAATALQNALDDADASKSGTIAGTTLTVSNDVGMAPGQAVSGVGVTPGTVLVSGSGTTWTVSPSQTVASTIMTFGTTTVTYDANAGAFVVTAGTPGTAGSITFSPNGTLSTALKLTQATGAVVSAGAAAGTPATAMEAVYASTQNFASFTTLFNPTDSDKLLFAQWAASKPNRFVYAMVDTTTAPTVVPDTTSLGYQIQTLNYGGVFPIYDASYTNGINVAAGIMGTAASIDFTRVNGRVTFAFRSFFNVAAAVTSQTIANALKANGYNFYGQYATSNNTDTFLYPGQVTGPFDWADSFFGQIKLNNALQLGLTNLLLSVGSIPFNDDGYALVEGAMMPAINDAVSFGTIRAGVPLDPAQAAEVNTAAGQLVSDTLQQRGWYVKVQPSSAATRAARGPITVLLFYMDGQSVQSINLSSVLVQ